MAGGGAAAAGPGVGSVAAERVHAGGTENAGAGRDGIPPGDAFRAARRCPDRPGYPNGSAACGKNPGMADGLDSG